MPVEVEDGLPRPFADVDDDSVLLQSLGASGVRDELEHPLRLLRGELADLSEAGHVPLGDDEEVDVGLGIYVRDCDESVRGRNVVALLVQLAEETVLRQR
jgi:hypothetical protein